MVKPRIAHTVVDRGIHSFIATQRRVMHESFPHIVNDEIFFGESENVIFDGENVIFDGEQVVAQ